MESEEPKKNGEKSELQDPETGKFIEGNPGGPGRPKGSISILTDLKAKLEKVKREHPEEYEALLDDYWKDKGKRELLIKMIDGMPKQQTDVTSGGERIGVILNAEQSEQLLRARANRNDTERDSE